MACGGLTGGAAFRPGATPPRFQAAVWPTASPELGNGELVHMFPPGRGPLPTLDGVTATPWSHHTAVVISDGSVLDPLLSQAFGSVAEWQATIVGTAKVFIQ